MPIFICIKELKAHPGIVYERSMENAVKLPWKAVDEFELTMEDFSVQSALSPLQTCIFSVITLQLCQDFVYQHSLNSSAAKLVMDNLIYPTTSLQDNHIMVLSRAYHLESTQDLQHAHRGRERCTDEKPS